jgi:signal transduction histidine kinase
MKLRTKVFAWIILTMGFVFAILTVNLLLEDIHRSEVHRSNVAALVQVMTQDWITKVGPSAPKSEQLAVLEQRLHRTQIFQEWTVYDSEYRPLFGRGAALTDVERVKREVYRAVGNNKTSLEGDVFIARIEYAPEPGGKVAEKPEYVLLRGRIKHDAAAEFDLKKSFIPILLTLGLGTGVMILTVAMVLERAVLRPLERLARASERVALGDYSTPVEETGSEDEIGDLLRAFNQMQRRLREYHETLEGRIADATDKVKGAERRLIVAQRLSATGTLAAGIAHEINNPLGGMLNAARALKRPDLKPERREPYLDLIVESLLRIQDTVKKVLQFSPRKVNPQAASLREILDRAIGLAQYKLDKKKVKLGHEAPDRLPNVFCDPSELVQVFLNLILNAIDATAEEKGRIRVHYQSGEGEVACSVTDNGCGMTEAELAQAFDLFYTTKGAEGTGLGLSVVYNIVQNHGGRIDVSSQKNVGTTFTVTLPVHREDQISPPAAIPAEEPTKV